MRERGPRLAAIRRLIGGGKVDSQETLIDLLRREGFTATQATLSRDLKALGIGKVPAPSGGYTYALPDQEHAPARDATFIQDFMRGYVSLEFSGALGLIKTLPGHASSVASALDNLHIRALLGTIAGDDTILVVPRGGVSSRKVRSALRSRLPGI